MTNENKVFSKDTGVPDTNVKIGADIIPLKDYVSSYVSVIGINKDKIVRNVITQLKSTPDQDYGDNFNRMVCANLDQILQRRLSAKGMAIQSITKDAINTEGELLREELDESKTINLLQLSEWIYTKQIAKNIESSNLDKYADAQRTKIASQLVENAYKFSGTYLLERQIELNPQKMAEFASLWVLLNTSQPYPFSETYSKQSVLFQMARSFFEDEDFTAVTFICMSYKHELNSVPGTVRVTPGEIEIKDGRDNDDIEALINFQETIETLRYFLGDKVKPYAILSDVDFVDVFQVTDEMALAEASNYYNKYEALCTTLGLIPNSLLITLSKNEEIRAAYDYAKEDILTNINQATRKTDWVKNPAFYYTEVYINKLTQSIYDYYNSLPGVTMSWDTAYQNTIGKLLVYGAQPEVLRSLFPDKFVYISSEMPVRDEMYMPRDRALAKEKMAIIYPFKFKKQKPEI